jgi:fumarylacetoacetate (FAA) hydrolase
MKLGTLRDGTQDGRLVVIDHDVTHATDVAHLAPSLLCALENWDAVAPELGRVARGLDGGAQPMERFHEREAQSPLPHGPRLLITREAAGPDDIAPRLRPIAADAFLAPRGTLPVADEISVSLAVAAGPVAAGASAAEAGETIRLVLLMLSLSGPEIEPGSEPVVFAPAAITPEALEAAGGWGLAPRLTLNDESFGPTRDPVDRAAFAAMIARAAEGGTIAAGSLIAGPALIKARIEPGDRIRIDMRERDGRSVFGAIEQVAGGLIERPRVTGAGLGVGMAAQMMWAPY